MVNLVRLLSDKMRMLREDAHAVARVVEEAFRGSDSVEDDDLDAQMRQLFYDLQDAQILDVKRREYECDGHIKRGYMWHVNEAPRLDHPAPRAPRAPEQDLYEALPTTAWSNRKRP